MSDKLPVVRRAIEAKRNRPEYQRLDLDVKEGGKSLLHDEHGIPKVASSSNKGDIPIMKEISNEPVQFRASVPEETESGGPSRRYLPSKSAEDRFIPPRSNFVSVGQVEQAWHADGGINDDVIDNNDNVNVEAVQGLDPLQGIAPENFEENTVKNQESLEIRKNVEANLTAIRSSAIAELAHVGSLDDIQTIKQSLFSKKKGIFTIILKKFGSLPASERPMIGEMVNECITDLRNEILAAEGEFDEGEGEGEDEDYTFESEEPEPEPEPEPVVTKQAQSHPEASKVSNALEEGTFGILVDDKLYHTNQDPLAIKRALSILILDKEIEPSRVQLIKRLSIDFGIIIGE